MSILRNLQGGARRELTIFGILTATLTCLSVAVAVAEGADVRRLDEASPLGQMALFGQAFYPGLAAVVARLCSARTVRGLGWGWGATRRYLRFSYALVWLTGLGGFEPAKLAKELPSTGAPDGLVALGATVLALTIGVLPWAALALGEEIGWRGLLVTRLAGSMSLTRVALWSGLAWSLFHVPFMLFVPGAVEHVPALYAVAMFFASTIALSFPLAWLQLRSGSVWPAVIAHAVHNAAIYFVGDRLTTDSGKTAWFSGETGLFLTLATVAVVAFWWSRLRGEPASVVVARLRPEPAHVASGD